MATLDQGVLVELPLPSFRNPYTYTLQHIHAAVMTKLAGQQKAKLKDIEYFYKGEKIPTVFWEVFTWLHVAPRVVAYPILENATGTADDPDLPAPPVTAHMFNLAKATPGLQVRQLLVLSSRDMWASTVTKPA